MPQYRAIIFDMGDVLFTWNPQAATRITAAAHRQMTKSKLWEDFERGQVTPEECYRQLASQVSVDPAEVAETFSQTTASLTPHGAMVSLIHDIKAANISVYMMTNIPRPDFDQLRAKDYIWGAFDGVFASGYVGMRKPDRCFYEHVLKEIGVAPQEAIFVDDKMENVIPATDVGIVGVHCVDIPQCCQHLRQILGA